MAVVWWIIGLGAFLLLLEMLLSDRIIFYRDKVTKVWHFFGSRTIPYSNARVILAYIRTNMWTISEGRPPGQYLALQIPIVCRPRHLSPPEASQAVKSILKDLACETKKITWADRNPELVKLLFVIWFAVLFGAIIFLVLYFT